MSNSVTIGISGTVSNYVRGVSGGLDLASGATLSITNGGKIVVMIESMPTIPTGIYWGLRWDGDHEVELQGLKDAGLLMVNDAFSAAKVFKLAGKTYFGLNFWGSVYSIR